MKIVKGHVVIKLEDGTVLEGEVILNQMKDRVPQSHKTFQPISRPTIVVKGKNDLASCIEKLRGQGFFKDTPVVRSSELIRALHLKCDKKIRMNHATRDLSKLVSAGILDRDELPPCKDTPNGTQLWYLPDTDKKIVVDYKRLHSSEAG
jgi:hypothetical protein